jgi:hypothetical protein
MMGLAEYRGFLASALILAWAVFWACVYAKYRHQLRNEEKKKVRRKIWFYLSAGSATLILLYFLIRGQ